MSRIAKYPILIPAEVDVQLQDQNITIKGPRATLTESIPAILAVTLEDQALRVSILVHNNEARRLIGTIYANLRNKIIGVSKGFFVHLKLEGVGYRAQLQDKLLILNVGYSKPKHYLIPEGVHVKLTSPTEIALEGADFQQVTQAASEIRRIRPPEVYHGTGIRNTKEKLKLKEAKKK